MTSDNRHDRNIDVIKGVMIIFVIITHYKWSGAQRGAYLFPFWIDMAVPVFMIIMGYVYAKSFLRHHITTFGEAYALTPMVKRINRYTIPFIITLVVCNN